MRKYFVPTIIIAVLAVLTATGVYSYFAMRTTNREEDTQGETIKGPGVYTNKNFGYSFQYAEGEYIFVRGSSVTVNEEDGGYWIFAVDVVPDDGVSLEQLGRALFDKHKPGQYVSEYAVEDMKLSDTVIGGIPAKQLIIDRFGDGHNFWAVLKNGGNVYYLSGVPNQERLKDFKFN